MCKVLGLVAVAREQGAEFENSEGMVQFGIATTSDVKTEVLGIALHNLNLQCIILCSGAHRLFEMCKTGTADSGC